jgi:hypothetical protein
MDRGQQVVMVAGAMVLVAGTAVAGDLPMKQVHRQRDSRDRVLSFRPCPLNHLVQRSDVRNERLRRNGVAKA